MATEEVDQMTSPTMAASDPTVLNLFRVWSTVYDHPIFQWVYYGRVHERLLDAAATRSPIRILDVGCGTGELLAKCARRWPDAELVGVDLSASMLAKGRAKPWGRCPPTFTEGNVYQLPFERGAFDLVFNSISSHFYRDGTRAFAEIARVTATGGRFYQASIGNGPLRLVPGPWKDGLSIPSAIYRSPQAQSALLAGAGFSVERVSRYLANTWLYECRRTRRGQR
jgi:ubiquinone/menaquinone biosynthesis C-methylase UbiE